MYDTTYDKVTDQLWKMCDTYGEEQVLEWLIELIEFRKGKEVLEKLQRR